MELELELELELEFTILVLPLCLVAGGVALKLIHRGQFAGKGSKPVSEYHRSIKVEREREAEACALL